MRKKPWSPYLDTLYASWGWVQGYVENAKSRKRSIWGFFSFKSILNNWFAVSGSVRSLFATSILTQYRCSCISATYSIRPSFLSTDRRSIWRSIVPLLWHPSSLHLTCQTSTSAWIVSSLQISFISDIVAVHVASHCNGSTCLWTRAKCNLVRHDFREKNPMSYSRLDVSNSIGDGSRARLNFNRLPSETMEERGIVYFANDSFRWNGW